MTKISVFQITIIYHLFRFDHEPFSANMQGGSEVILHLAGMSNKPNVNLFLAHSVFSLKIAKVLVLLTFSLQEDLSCVSGL